jgi:hypothetical protein
LYKQSLPLLTHGAVLNPKEWAYLRPLQPPIPVQQIHRHPPQVTLFILQCIEALSRFLFDQSEYYFLLLVAFNFTRRRLFAQLLFSEKRLFYPLDWNSGDTLLNSSTHPANKKGRSIKAPGFRIRPFSIPHETSGEASCIPPARNSIHFNEHVLITP